MLYLKRLKNRGSDNFFYVNPENLCNFKNLFSIFSFGFHSVNNKPVDSKKPGIEIMMKRGTYYDIIDNMGLDSFTNKKENITGIHQARMIANGIINDFIDTYLLQYESGTKEYQHNLATLIETCPKPREIFELHILGNYDAFWFPLNFDLHDAIESGINIDIDPICASKRLAIHAKESKASVMMNYNRQELT